MDKTKATNAKGEAFESEVDKSGNILSVSYNGEPQWQAAYGKNGNVTHAKDDVSGETVTNLCDKNGRQLSHTVTNGATETYRESVTYDSVGKATETNLGSRKYEFSYKPNTAKTLEGVRTGEYTFKPHTDLLGRNAGRSIENSGKEIAYEKIGYRKVGDRATNMPFSVSCNGSRITYKYDKMQNIREIRENGDLIARYTYDTLNRLLREDNKALKKTESYEYDSNGNILSKRTYDFTLQVELDELVCEVKRYTYNGDKLTSYNSETCEYDVIGNPTLYRGKPMTWTKGRNLTTYDGVSFSYNALGKRTSKGSIKYLYSSSGKLIKQSNGLEFMYDASGLSAIEYDTKTYLYRKDAQGNITALLDKTGNVVVKYVYDAWGNQQVQNPDGADLTDLTHIGNLNPFRYRGYYYDTETGLYFLQTRYYDPTIGRFINADDISYLDPESINGLNLYAYCGSNPVKNIDPDGRKWYEFWKWDWKAIGKGALQVLGAVAAIGISIATFGAGTPLAMAIVAGVTLGAGLLMGINGIATIGEGISGGYNFMRDGLFNEVLGLSDDAYNIYSNVVSSVAAIGTAILGVYSFTGRAQAARAGRNFMGKGYSKEGPGRWVSKDGLRQMRLDKSHHLFKGASSPHHFNLGISKVPIAPGVRTGRLKEIHRMFNWFRTWIG